jgi:hypothetical protein
MVELASQIHDHGGIHDHSGHIVLAVAWLFIFGAIFGFERLCARRRARRHRPMTR